MLVYIRPIVSLWNLPVHEDAGTDGYLEPIQAQHSSTPARNRREAVGSIQHFREALGLGSIFMAVLYAAKIEGWRS